MSELIEPKDIEVTLEKIWASLEGTNKMRACLFNLVLYVKTADREEYLKILAERVIQKFPSRIILVSLNDKCPGVETTASCVSASDGDCGIVCDFIEMKVCASEKEKIPFLVLPHILPDLPVYVVLGDLPEKDHKTAYALEKFATRVIFDSECTDDLKTFADVVLEHRKEIGCDVADLNWARIEGWRELLAATFHSPDDLESLNTVSTIHMHYNSSEGRPSCHAKVPAIYLQGWLALRMGWTFKKATPSEQMTCFEYESGGFPILVYLHAKKVSSLPPGRVISVDIETRNEMKYTLTRDLDVLTRVTIQVSSPEVCHMPSHYLFGSEQTGQTLVQEVCHKGTSRHFIELLEFLSNNSLGEIC